RRCRGGRGQRARRPDGRVLPGRARALLPQRRQPPRRGATAAARDRGPRGRVDGTGAARRQRRLPAGATQPRARRARAPARVAAATGGLVPPALLGHTPDIAPRYDPDLARRHLAGAPVDAPLELVGTRGDEIEPIVELLAEQWRDVLGVDVELKLLDELYAAV